MRVHVLARAMVVVVPLVWSACSSRGGNDSATSDDAFRHHHPYCGDGACNGVETCGTCPEDCGPCPPPDAGSDASDSGGPPDASADASDTGVLNDGGPPWSGILDPSRAVDWTHAGIPGGIPSRTTICRALSS